MSSIITGAHLELEATVTANAAGNVTLTPFGAPTGQHVWATTTVVVNGAGAHFPASGGPERYRIRIEKIL